MLKLMEKPKCENNLQFQIIRSDSVFCWKKKFKNISGNITDRIYSNKVVSSYYK